MLGQIEEAERQYIWGQQAEVQCQEEEEQRRWREQFASAEEVIPLRPDEIEGMVPHRQSDTEGRCETPVVPIDSLAEEDEACGAPLPFGIRSPAHLRNERPESAQEPEMPELEEEPAPCDRAIVRDGQGDNVGLRCPEPPDTHLRRGSDERYVTSWHSLSDTEVQRR